MRRSGLPFEEIRPLELDEIEFGSDVSELYENEFLCECSICGEEASVLDEDEEEIEGEVYCENCQKKIEN